MKRRYKWLLALLLAGGIPYYWLLVDNRPGSAPAHRLELARMRALAEQVPGPKPVAIEVQLVGWVRLPGTLMVAGGGLKRNQIAIFASRLRGPWGDIVIDSGIGQADAERLGLERFVAADQARVDAALRTARRIVFTHEHRDHLAGLLRLPDFARVARRALITPEQGPAAALPGAAPWPAGAGGAVAPFRYAGMAAIAPGVVLVRTPGHTPGSQMVYVRLGGGREVLFTGDTATMARSWQELRARSRLIAEIVAPEDRTAVFGWLKALRALKRSAPRLYLVPGHDLEYLYRTAPVDLVSFSFGTPPRSGTRATDARFEGGHGAHARLNGRRGSTGASGTGTRRGAAG